MSPTIQVISLSVLLFAVTDVPAQPSTKLLAQNSARRSATIPRFQIGHSTVEGCDCLSPSVCSCRNVRFSRVGTLRSQLRADLQRGHWGFAAYFCERPFGSFAKLTLDNQIASALRQQLVLYDIDFTGSQLSSRGEYQAHKVARKLQAVSGPVVVQASGDADLDQRRRLVVIDALQQAGSAVTIDEVEVRRILRPGVSAAEAKHNYDNLLKQTMNGGAGRPSSEGTAALPTNPIQ